MMPPKVIQCDDAESFDGKDYRKPFTAQLEGKNVTTETQRSKDIFSTSNPKF